MVKISKFNVIVKELTIKDSEEKIYKIYAEDVSLEEFNSFVSCFKENISKKIRLTKKNSLITFSLFLTYNEILEILKNKSELIKEINDSFNNFISFPSKIKIGNRIFEFGNKTFIMGILNVTPDSFYDGYRYFKKEKAIEQALYLSNFSDIIDVGGESTRPGSERISEEEELRRVIPVIKEIRKKIDIPISIDTYKSKVAEEAISAGADMINDISGLIADEKMPEVVLKYDIPIVLMHIRGNPKIMLRNPIYEDIVHDIIRSLRRRIEYAKLCGIKEEKIIIDPGIGFGKNVEDNIEIIKRLREFKCLGRPILVGPSRKSFIGKILDLPVEERLEGTLAVVTMCILNGANIIRVHDVKENYRIVKIINYFNKYL